MSKQLLTKKLLYRSLHRGCKETDFLIGNFAKNNLQNMDMTQLHLFEKFLEEDDMLIYDWVLDKKEYPQEYNMIIADIRRVCVG